MKFQATIQLNGKTATGIQVPPDVVAGLGAGKQPPVRVTIKGYTYRSSVAVMSGVFMVGVNSQVRAAAGVAAGEVVDVELELDTEPRQVIVPDDFGAALDCFPAARTFFDGLSYSNKRRFVMAIDDAKTPETRQRRIEKSVSTLREGRV